MYITRVQRMDAVGKVTTNSQPNVALDDAIRGACDAIRGGVNASSDVVGVAIIDGDRQVPVAILVLDRRGENTGHFCRQCGCSPDDPCTGEDGAASCQLVDGAKMCTRCMGRA